MSPSITRPPRAEARELPALMGIEEIAICPPHMAFRRHAGAAPKHELIAHELAVIFADGSGCGLEARIGEVGACRPFPHIAEHLLETRTDPRRHRPQMAGAERAAFDGDARRRDLPFEFRRQPVAGPAGEGVGLVIADMGDRRGGIDRAEAHQAHLPVTALGLLEIKRSFPSLALHRVPAIGEPKRGRGIAAILDELDPLGIGDRAARQV